MEQVLSGGRQTKVKKGLTQWNLFSEDTKYFPPSIKDFMINYRVDNLDQLVEELRKENVTILDEIESFDYGKCRIGKAYIYIKRLLDINTDILETMARSTIAYLNEHHECACHV